MTRFRAVLDRSRPHGIVYGSASHRYEQDGKCFDHQGLEVDEKGRPIIQQRQRSSELKQATLGSGTDRSAASRSAAAERMRRARKRRRRGVVAVVDVEITTRDVDQFVSRNILSPDEVHDRKRLADAVRRALEIWDQT